MSFLQSFVLYFLTVGFDFEFGTHYNNTPRQRKSAELMHTVVVSKEMSPSPPKVFRSLSDGGTVFPVSRRLYSSGYGKYWWPSRCVDILEYCVYLYLYVQLCSRTHYLCVASFDIFVFIKVVIFPATEVNVQC